MSTELVVALAKAQAEMQMPKLDATNPAFKKPDGSVSRYATLTSIINAVRPALTSNGIAYIQRSAPVDGGVSVETVFMGHGGLIETGPVVVKADKQSAQGYGSALTYARRFSLAMACGVAAEDDDDGEGAGKDTITAEQAAWIKAALKATESDVEAFLRMAGAQTVDSMEPRMFPMAQKALEGKAKKMGVEL